MQPTGEFDEFTHANVAAWRCYFAKCHTCKSVTHCKACCGQRSCKSRYGKWGLLTLNFVLITYTILVYNCCVDVATCSWSVTWRHSWTSKYGTPDEYLDRTKHTRSTRGLTSSGDPHHRLSRSTSLNGTGRLERGRADWCSWRMTMSAR